MSPLNLDGTSLPTLPPHVAGAKIRVLAQAAKNNLLNTTAHNTAAVEVPQFDSVKFANWGEKAQIATTHLREAARARRAAPAIEALDRLLQAKEKQIVTLQDHNYRLRKTTEVLHMKVISFQSTSQIYVNDHDTGDNLTLTQVLSKIVDLSQSFPTQPGLPSADSKDIALRAICAVLRTHKIPGSENLSQEPIEEVSDANITDLSAPVSA